MFSASKTAAPVSGSFQVSNSLRFRSAASAYLNRTPASAGNRTTWTWSGWVKRGALSSQMTLFGCMPVTGTDSTYFEMQFTAGDVLNIAGFSTNFAVTSQVFRDPSSWYHIVLSVDTTQATSTNRIRLYVNGSQVTAFGTTNYPAQNATLGVNQNIQHSIASQQPYNATRNFDGYLADINFIDGQALTPSSFGQINPTTGVWQPIKYAGSYGTNGFHLNFSNGTSTTTLGYDSSGNGNNWTPNNISLTAGSTYDWMLDSPTPYAGTSYGVGNYAVLNPLTVQGLAPYNANLTLGATTSYSGKLASIGVSSGKWYWEQTIDYVWSNTLNQSQIYGGVSTASASLNGFYGIAGHWGFANCDISGATSGSVNNGTLTNGYTLMTTGGVVGLALDMDSGSLSVYRNNVFLYSVGTNLAGNTVYPIIVTYVGASNSYTSINFGQRPFAYTPPSGYKTLCTQNLPSPTIQNGSNFMAATLYTGNGSTQSIVNTVNGVSFQPDFVWIKRRNLTANHQLYDSIRGVQKALYSDLTSQELTQTGGITAFLSNGITVGSDAGVNGNGDTQVAWNWKAGGTAVTNTAGSITSQVSANTTAGFSVVTYTCQSSGSGTIGHGLGVAPSMIISKGRGTVTSWGTYHVSNGWNGYLVLNGTNSFITDPNGMNNTAPTSSVWTQGTTYAGIGTNVAYCFAAIAGYSAFGSFQGNASTDGVFVWTGFLPRLIMLKCSSGTGNWYMLDSSRNTYDVVTNQLYPNLSNAESSVVTLDILSNGFKMRISTDPNASATYIYAAWASSPFNSSLAF